ncbi:MAG: ABC transporter ATP-binding protein [Peptococcaceae bacterium]|nr:ABC transporter ATP-binding protein [Peptococcaceae bacterium]
MTALLECKNLSKVYDKKQALNTVNLSIERGRIVGLLGPNGSGKTTLIKLINGLLQPTTGEVLVNGIAPGIESKKVVAYLPDKTYLNEWMTIKDLLQFFADFYDNFNMEKAKAMLKDLSIDETVKLKTLSKGNKEKVQLILVMAREAELYLLDEPIGGVDPAARDYILKTILTNYNSNASILLSTHLIQDVEQIFDDIIFLNQGNIVLDEPVDKVREERGKSIDALFREVFKC